jgi:hypothetical protein
MISTKTMISLQQTTTVVLNTTRDFMDHIYKNIYENLIGLIKLTQIRAIQNASMFTRSIKLIRRKSLHMTSFCWLNPLTVHASSPDGDFSW